MPLPLMFVSLLTCWVSMPQSSAAVTLDCENFLLLGETFYRYFEHRCYTSGDPSSTLVWTVTSETGIPSTMATCYSVNNCTTHSSGIEARRDGVSTWLQVIEAVREMSGVLLCTEQYSNGTEDSASCAVSVAAVRFKDCPTGHEVLEDRSITLSCDVSPSVVLKWQLVSSDGRTTDISTCYDYNNCTYPDNPNIIVYRWSFDSEMTLDPIQRDMAGIIVCTDGTDSANCSLDVQNPTTVENCSIQVHSDNWTAVASCDVTRAYSALSNYGFMLEQEWQSALSSSVLRNFLFDGRVQFMPAPYIDSATGSEFFRGRYFYSWPLQRHEGNYTYITYTYPAGVATTIDHVLRIERPSPPSVQCEGTLRGAGRVPCVCSTSSLGSPAGRLIWFSGDTVLAVGQYGVTSLQFPSDVAVDNKSGVEVKCQLDWIVTENVSTTLFASCEDPKPETPKPTQPTLKPESSQKGDDSTSAFWRGFAVGAGVVLGLTITILGAFVLWKRRRSESNAKFSRADRGQSPTSLHNFTDLQFQTSSSVGTGTGKRQSSGYSVT